MSIEPAPKVDNESLEAQKDTRNATGGMDSSLSTGYAPEDDERDGPGRVAFLKVYGRNGILQRDHIIKMDPGKREEIINGNG